jgi:tRNA threonylcarbamoyladenosine biosynthesis protein TsaB
MKVLGIDTSTEYGSVGIVHDDVVVAEYALKKKETHSTRLLPAIEELLTVAGMTFAEIDGVAVTRGPGSFTGLRVGLSTVKGLVFASGKPVVGVPTLDALARNIPFTQHQICPVMDARKGEVYIAVYRCNNPMQWEQETPYLVLPPERLGSAIPCQPTIFLGNGVPIAYEHIRKALGDEASFAPSHLGFLRGSTVAELGRLRLEAGESTDIAALVPIYVRASDAEITTKKKHGIHK